MDQFELESSIHPENFHSATEMIMETDWSAMRTRALKGYTAEQATNPYMIPQIIDTLTEIDENENKQIEVNLF